MPALGTKELFDPAFLEAVGRLHIRARRVAGGGRQAEQRSRDLGTGIEFKDFRPYSPGDDFRAIDWTIYRRLGRVFLRLFEETEDLPVYLCCDVSRSMFLEDPPRARAGLRCALALAAVALDQHDTVGLFPFAEDLRIALRPQAGKGRILRFAHILGALEPGGETDLARSMASLEALRLREGLVVVISDFFDRGGLDAVLPALKRLRHRLLLVQLLRPGDRDPTVSGDLELRDCESGLRTTVSITPRLLEAYRRSWQAFERGLVGFAQRRGAGLLQLDADAEVLPQLATLFETGSYLV